MVPPLIILTRKKRREKLYALRGYALALGYGGMPVGHKSSRRLTGSNFTIAPDRAHTISCSLCWLTLATNSRINDVVDEKELN